MNGLGRLTARTMHLVAALALVLSVWGCARRETWPGPTFGEPILLGRSFFAEVQGTRNGMAFSAKIMLSPSEDGTCIRVEYLAPDVLAGIAVEAVCTQTGSLNGDAGITRGETAEQLEAARLEGLLSPAACLLRPADYTEVQREGDEYRFGFADGVTLRLNGEGDLLSYASPQLEYHVVWLESGVHS